MLHISDQTVSHFQAAGCQRLAREIALHIAPISSVDEAHRYIDEGWQVGLRTDQELAEFALLLANVDRSGRTAAIDDLVKDRNTHSQLKLFQLRYALGGGQS
ncbi:MAG: hypothetical protein GW858_05425 [Sphingomonadales bacterium]|nr:hypothetical protein [Sphingomonadales bacterium]NCQ21334.1 hypothetical protein [Sphingomonadales bacterium]NCT03497.1 hypothetical protein [Sphingomonadales bacterium]